MQNPQDNTNGIPVGDNGIPNEPESILSPIQMGDLGDDNDEEDYGFDSDGGVGVRLPRDPDDLGGLEAEEEYEDDDDIDTGLGLGFGLFLTAFPLQTV